MKMERKRIIAGIKRAHERGDQSHAIYTPLELCEEIVDQIPSSNGDNLVVATIEFVYTLIDKGVNKNNIWFASADPLKRAIVSQMVPSKNVFAYRVEGKKLVFDTKKKNFSVVLGNPPFNDNSETAGRSVDKIKENTTNLDVLFYRKMVELGGHTAIILKSNYLAKKSNLRSEIFADPSVKLIWNTTKWFNIELETMVIVRDLSYSSDIKDIRGPDNISWQLKSTSDTKLSLNIPAAAKDIYQKINLAAKFDNFGNHWMRGIPSRNNKLITDQPTGIPIVDITGNYPNIKYWAGDVQQPEVFDRFKVITNVNGNRTRIGAIKIVPPYHDVSNSVIFFVAENEEIANNIKLYLESTFVNFLTKIFKVSNGNSSEFFNNIPWIDFSRTWTDEELYDHFGLKEEQNYIEKNVK